MHLPFGPIALGALVVVGVGCGASAPLDVTSPSGMEEDGGATPAPADAGEGMADAASAAIDGGTNPAPPPEAGTDATPSSEDAGDAGPLPAPWEIVDLSGWALDLPVNAAGQESGTHDAVVVSALNASFPSLYAPYFHSVAGGGIVLDAPVGGATTTNSNYPRSELAETGYSKAHGGSNWPLTLGGTMNVAIAIDRAPSINGGTENGDLVIGQIKGTQTELCKIRYTGGNQTIDGTPYTIYVEYNNASVSGDFGIVPVSAGLGAQEKIGYEIVLANNVYSVSITFDGKTFKGSSGALDPSWQSDTYYFKAGVYTQANNAGQGGDTKGNGAGEVTLYALGVTHP